MKAVIPQLDLDCIHAINQVALSLTHIPGMKTEHPLQNLLTHVSGLLGIF